MSDASRVQLAYGAEVSWGTIPAIAFQETRMTGEGLNFNIQNITSDEIRSDRQITDLVQVDAEAAGPINVEMSYGTYDDFLEAALFSAGWSAAVAVSETDISASNADNSFNTVAGDFVTDGVQAGMWILVGGFTDTTLNTYHKVVSVTAAKIVVDGTLATEAAGNTITMTNSGMIRNGTTESSFVIEKSFTDKTQFHTFAGCVVSAMNWNLASQEILNGSFEFLGKDMTRGTATAGTGPYTAASTTGVMNAVANVASVREDGTEIASPIFIQELSLSLSNNLRGLKAIANLGNVDIGTGRLAMTGTMVVYFENGDLVDDFINGTEKSIDFRVADAAGNAYIFTLPRLKFSTQEAVAQAIDTDVMLDMEFQAIREATNDVTIQIDRFAAP